VLWIIAHFVKHGMVRGSAYFLAAAGGAWFVVGLIIAFADYWAPDLLLPDASAVQLFAPPLAVIALAGLCAAAAHFSLELDIWKPRIEPFIEGLKQRGDVVALVRALRYREDEIRIPAAEALGELGTYAALRPLVRSIGSEAPNRGLQRALTHRDPAVRGRVFQMLKEVEIERFFGLILRLLNDPGLDAEARSLVEQQQPAMVVRHLLDLRRSKLFQEYGAIRDTLIRKGRQVLDDESLSFRFRYRTATALFEDARWSEGSSAYPAWSALFNSRFRDAVALGEEAILLIKSKLMQWLEVGIPDYKAEEAVWAIRRIGGPLAVKTLEGLAQVRAVQMYSRDALADLRSANPPRPTS